MSDEKFNSSDLAFPFAIEVLTDDGWKRMMIRYSTKEVAAKDAEMEKRFAGTMQARAAIVEFLGGPWKQGRPGISGVMDCPVCNGDRTLSFSRSGYNGHIHAACRTKDCVSWME